MSLVHVYKLENLFPFCMVMVWMLGSFKGKVE